MKIASIIIAALFAVYLLEKFLLRPYCMAKYAKQQRTANASDLKEPTISKLYAPLIQRFNTYAYGNQGTITVLEREKLQLYKTDSCQILYFTVNRAQDLEIEWRFMYFRQEMIFRHTVHSAEFDTHNAQAQETLFQAIVAQFNEQYSAHEKRVDESGIPEKILAEQGISAENWKTARAFLRE
ncbi:MAG: hypothetical protein LBU90_10710 [Bacteroidales bacterium]|jgi:hypothetical protein|nr:hypothetical protein [Bacteroidales bacterium]